MCPAARSRSRASASASAVLLHRDHRVERVVVGRDAREVQEDEVVRDVTWPEGECGLHLRDRRFRHVEGGARLLRGERERKKRAQRECESLHVGKPWSKVAVPPQKVRAAGRARDRHSRSGRH